MLARHFVELACRPAVLWHRQRLDQSQRGRPGGSEVEEGEQVLVHPGVFLTAESLVKAGGFLWQGACGSQRPDHAQKRKSERASISEAKLYPGQQ